MVPLTDLWLPILLSSVALFFASSIIWMALPIHKGDYKPLREHEGPIFDAIKNAGLASGLYMFPFCSHGKEPKSPELEARLKSGPFGTICVMNSTPNMGKALGLWIVNLLLVTTLVAYIASHALKPGADYLSVFRIVATAALLAHAGNALTDSIWKGRPWSHLPGALFDGVVYAALTAGFFSWLWPKAAAAVGA
jgi:hypothetical protein